MRERLRFTPLETETLARGAPVVREIPGDDPNEVVLLAAIRVTGNPAAFVAGYENVESLVDGQNYLAAQRLHDPPSLQDLAALRLDPKDLDQIRHCRPGDCEFQLTASAMRQLQSADSPEAAAAIARRMVLDSLVAYRHEGDRALGEYRDKSGPADVAATFRSVLSRAENLADSFPAFYRYFLHYPSAPPTHLRDFFYWERVAFGLKPTFRVNHVVISQPPGDRAPWLIGNKQLYSSHYFQAAIDLWLCLREDGAHEFVLVTWKGSRQQGLTGPKGRLLRSVAVKRSREALQTGLLAIKVKLERER
ncbi:MAG: hypothetical protein U0Q16_11390 [Bryobacteraceae bacterium]